MSRRLICELDLLTPHDRAALQSFAKLPQPFRLKEAASVYGGQVTADLEALIARLREADLLRMAAGRFYVAIEPSLLAGTCSDILRDRTPTQHLEGSSSEMELGKCQGAVPSSSLELDFPRKERGVQGEADNGTAPDTPPICPKGDPGQTFSSTPDPFSTDSGPSLVPRACTGLRGDQVAASGQPSRGLPQSACPGWAGAASSFFPGGFR